MSGQKQKGFGYGGFAIKPKGVGLETQLAQMGYGLPSMSGRSQSSVLHIGKKRVRNEDELVLLLISYRNCSVEFFDNSGQLRQKKGTRRSR